MSCKQSCTFQWFDETSSRTNSNNVLDPQFFMNTISHLQRTIFKTFGIDLIGFLDVLLKLSQCIFRRDILIAVSITCTNARPERNIPCPTILQCSAICKWFKLLLLVFVWDMSSPCSVI